MSYIDIVFDGPPGPVPGRFVEVEDHNGYSVRVGEWMDRGDGTWALRLQAPTAASVEAQITALREALSYIERKLTDPEVEAEITDAWRRAQTALAQPYPNV